MSSRLTVATSSRSLTPLTGPASAAAAAGRRRAVVELEFLAFPVLPLRTMMRPIDQEAKPRPYMRAAHTAPNTQICGAIYTKELKKHNTSKILTDL